MLVFTALLLASALLQFGGVMPDWYIPAAVFWVTATGGVMVYRALKRGALDHAVVGLFVAGCLAIVWLGPMLTIWILSTGWAWIAARENVTSGVTYLKILVVIGVLEAILGLVQHFVAPGWIFDYQNRSNSMSGTLINRNHFAGLLEMLIPCCVGLGFIGFRRSGNLAYSNVYIMAGAFCGVALAVSQARMGIVCFIASVVLLCIVVPVKGRQKALVTGLGIGLVGIVFAGLLWIGMDGLVGRYGELLKSDPEKSGGRLTIYRNTLDMIRHFPFGVGVGNYGDAFPPFQTTHSDLLYDHAHNDYLETAAEWGLFIAIPFWTAVFAVFTGLIRSLLMPASGEVHGILLACVGGIFAILLHSLVDFNLQIPSNAMVFFSLIGIGMGILFPQKTLQLL